MSFDKRAGQILDSLQFSKETIRLTYRGKPVADLVPVKPPKSRRPPQDDPFYRILEHATPHGENLTNREIDRIVYGQS